MINAIGPTGVTRLESPRADAIRRGAPAAPTTTVGNDLTTQAPASPAQALAADGAPIDEAKIARVKAAIAEGRYPVDAQAIAAKMLELDLPA